MANCYSAAGSAPLNALANQLLGDSTFSAKSSLFRPMQQQQQQQQHQQQHLHRQYQHYQSGLFPRQPQPDQHSKQQQSCQKLNLIDTTDSFEHTWSLSSSSLSSTAPYPHQPHLKYVELPQRYHPGPGAQQQYYPSEQYLPDLDLVSAWERQEQLRLQTQPHSESQHQVQAALSGVLMAPSPEFCMDEFSSFAYAPAGLDAALLGKENITWAQEWSRRQGSDDTDDDEGDEFREEWNNDHFTQAYINSHQSQFREIEEQDRLKQARLEEERERQRQATGGGPPRSAWMMAGSAVTASETAHGPRRLRVPGLDTITEHSRQEQSKQDYPMLSMDEFMAFDYDHQRSFPQQQAHKQLQSQPQQQDPQLKPVHVQDRFLSLVSDLHLAEQIYYPGASSATLPELTDPDSHVNRPSDCTAQAALVRPQSALPTGRGGEELSGWAQEFAVEDQQKQQQRQRYGGAEWNWEKTFGKDPRRQLHLATRAHEASLANQSAINVHGLDENERLRATALTRLQALFGHLSLTASPACASPASAP